VHDDPSREHAGSVGRDADGERLSASCPFGESREAHMSTATIRAATDVDGTFTDLTYFSTDQVRLALNAKPARPAGPAG
ncbi:MAG: hypothetical protein ACRDK8_09475, partial [Solirubrobacteraceae bacterium]